MADLVKLGQSVKAKYPQYSNLPDEEVGKRVLAKYPQYSNYGDSTRPTSQQNTGNLVSGNDPKIILNAILSLIPGATYVSQKASEDFGANKPKGLKAAAAKSFSNITGYPGAVGSDLLNMVKGLPAFMAGSVATPALTASQAVGGPSKLDLPLVGQLQSFQEQQKGLQEQGAGGALSTALPAVQWLASLAGAKGVTKFAKGKLTGKKPVVTPVTTPTEPTTKTPAIPSPQKQGFMQIVGRTETNLRSSGASGVELADKLKTSNRNQGYIRGNYDFNYLEATRKLTPEEKINFAKSLDGTATPLSEKVAIAVEKQRANDRNIAQLAQSGGLQTRDSIGRTHPFSPLENYYPHKPTEEAFTLMETPKGIENIAAKMVEEGKVKTVAEGVDIINKYIKPASMGIRSPNLRISRQYDLPSEFIEWNPDKVLPAYGERAASDLAFAKQFGAKGEGAKALIEGIRQSGGDYQYAQNTLDAISHGVQATEPVKAVASVATALQTVAKLPLAVVINLWQGIVNSAVYKGTLRHLIKDTQAARSQAGHDFALKSGVIEHSLSDISALTESVGTSKWTKFARKLLGDTRFTGSERFNRVFSANAGKSLIESETIKLLKNPSDALARRHLKRLGINPDEVIRQGGVTEQQVMEGAYEFVHQTQYGAGVLDRPLWASHPLGKVVFQFKQFSYGANNFIIQSVVNEAKKGNYGPLMAALTVPVIPGMISKKAKDTIRGNQPKEQGLIRDAIEIYANGIGIGIFYDAVVSATYGTGSVMGFMFGPTAGMVGDVGGAIGQGSPKKLTKTLLPYVPAAMSQTPLKPLAVPTAVALQALTKRMFNSNNK